MCQQKSTMLFCEAGSDSFSSQKASRMYTWFSCIWGRILRAFIGLGQTQILRHAPNRPKWAGEARSWNKPREKCETNWRKIRQTHWIIQQNLCSWQNNKTNACMMLYGTIQCFPHWGLYGYEIERITAQFTCLEQVRWTQWMNVLQFVGIEWHSMA